MREIFTKLPLATMALLFSSLAAAQISPYVYVKMSLGVPWFLYFVFMLCVLLPFLIMIIIAWRRRSLRDEEQ